MGFLSDIGDAVGGLLGGQQQNVTTTAGPHRIFQPAIRDILGQAGSLYGNLDPQYSNLYAGLNPFQQQGINELGAFDPNATNAATGYVSKVLGGDFLNSNPWLDQTFNQGADALQARMGSQFAMAGRDVGPQAGGAFKGATAQGLSDLATGIYGGNYQAERDRMGQAAGMAPGLDRASMGGALARLQAGSLQQADQQAQLAEADRAANFDYDSGWDELSKYLGVVSPLSSGYGTQTQPYFRNPLMGALGGAVAGNSLVPGGAGMLGGGLLGLLG